MILLFSNIFIHLLYKEAGTNMIYRLILPQKLITAKAFFDILRSTLDSLAEKI